MFFMVSTQHDQRGLRGTLLSGRLDQSFGNLIPPLEISGARAGSIFWFALKSLLFVPLRLGAGTLPAFR